MAGIQAQDRLIFALDVSSAREAEPLLDRLQDSVGVVKIGLELFVSEGPAVIRLALDRGKQVFLDLKFLYMNKVIEVE